MKIYAYKNNDDLDEAKLQKMRSVLSIMENKKIDSFKRTEDAMISLLSRFLLRTLSAQRLGVNPEEIMFFYNEYHRPYLPDFDFNVSHSGDWVVLVFIEQGRVGIDIEKMRTVEETLADMCFTEEERKYLFFNNNFNQEKFFELWTLKESFIKADGKGLSYPLQDFYFCLEDKIKINFKKKKKKENWNFRLYELDSEYKLSLCSENKNFPEDIIIIEDLNNFLA